MAHYGYEDGSGAYFITIDTDRCDGCGACLTACPARVFEVMEEDPNDPLREGAVAVVAEAMRRRLKYACGPCKPPGNPCEPPCVTACGPGALSHAW